MSLLFMSGGHLFSFKAASILLTCGNATSAAKIYINKKYKHTSLIIIDIFAKSIQAKHDNYLHSMVILLLRRCKNEIS